MTNKIFDKTLKQSSLILFFLVGAFFISCNDNPGVIGLDIIPPDDEIFVYFDTSTNIQTHTVYKDSIRSDEGVLSASRSYSLLGNYIDPVFGASNAEFFTQVRLSKNQVDFGEDFILDSMILYLKLVNIYGDNRTSPLDVSVYQLTDTINVSESYYSDINPENYFDPNEVIGQKSISPNITDSIISISINHLEFLDLLTDTNNLIDNDAFLKVFKGLYITTNQINTTGTIMSFDMLSVNSKLKIYYHNYSETTPIIPMSAHSSFDLLINEKCARVNIFQHDYSMGETPIQNINDYTIEDTLVYVQAMGGVKVKVDITDVLKWQDSTGVVISSARLHIPVLENSTEIFEPLVKLNLAYINDEGTNEFFPDIFHNGTFYPEYFDGKYNQTLNAYEFNIGLYIQKMIDNELPLNGFYIYPYSTENPTMANRVILKGGKANEGIKLYITYIKL